MFKFLNNKLYIVDSVSKYSSYLYKDVISINVVKGHGFINLINFKDYIGEKLLINDDDAYDIEDEMKIAVSEGENLIIVKTDKSKGTKLIDIKRGDTVNIDVSKMKFETKKEGYITFDVEPKSARLYINGRLYSNKNNILLDYGKYNYNDSRRYSRSAQNAGLRARGVGKARELFIQLKAYPQGYGL